MTKDMEIEGAGELENPVEDPRVQRRDKEVATWNKMQGSRFLLAGCERASHAGCG